MRRATKRTLTAALVTGGLAAGGILAPTTAALAADPVSGPPSAYTLAFSDDFDGTALDTDVWGYRQNSNTSRENVSVSGGFLRLNQTRVSTSSGLDGFRGAGVTTLDRFGYGYYEIQAELPANAANGWHPAFWTQVWDGQYPKPKYGTSFTEIDIFEQEKRAAGERVDGGWFTWNATAAGDVETGNNYSSRVRHVTKDVAGQPVATDYTALHRYGALYTASGISFYFDGAYVGTAAISTLPNSPMSVWLSTIPLKNDDLDRSKPVGSDYGSFDIDWVRYYAPPGGIPATMPASVASSASSITEDFAGGTAGHWTTNGVGSWSVASVAGDLSYRNTGTAGDAISRYTGSGADFATWANGTVQANITLTASGAGAGILGRYVDDSHYYYLRLNKTTNALDLVKKDGASTVVLGSHSLSVATGTNYTIALTLDDAVLTASLNGSPVITATDYRYIVGSIGVKGYNQPFSVRDVSFQG